MEKANLASWIHHECPEIFAFFLISLNNSQGYYGEEAYIVINLP